MNTLSSLLMFIGNSITKSRPMLGEIRLYAGSTAPQGWKICNGEALSRSEYSELFTAIGTTYGSGNGSTTFNLPDFRGRTAIGSGTGTASDATAHSLGSIGGEEKHALNSSENGEHSHTYAVRSGGQAGGNMAIGSNGAGGSGTYTPNASWSGSGTPHNNMQPYTTINYIIYAGE